MKDRARPGDCRGRSEKPPHRYSRAGRFARSATPCVTIEVRLTPALFLADRSSATRSSLFSARLVRKACLHGCLSKERHSGADSLTGRFRRDQLCKWRTWLAVTGRRGSNDASNLSSAPACRHDGRAFGHSQNGLFLSASLSTREPHTPVEPERERERGGRR